MKKHGNGSEVYISYDYDHAVRAYESGCDALVLNASGDELRILDTDIHAKYVFRNVHVRDDPCCCGWSTIPVYASRVVGRVTRRYVITSPSVSDERIFEFIPNIRRIERRLDAKTN